MADEHAIKIERGSDFGRIAFISPLPGRETIRLLPGRDSQFAPIPEFDKQEIKANFQKQISEVKL